MEELSLDVVFMQVGLLEQMPQQTDFQWFVAMDRDGQPYKHTGLRVDMMTAGDSF